jgi:hypothetical protein
MSIRHCARWLLMSAGMSPNKLHAITLIELLIALVLLSMIILGIANIEIFCKHVFMGADRKTKVSNEVTYVVEHMSKHIGMAVGDDSQPPVDTLAPLGCTNATLVWTDYDPSGIPNGVRDNINDRQIMYCFNDAAHSVAYYSNYTSMALPGPVEVLARNIYSMNATVIRNAVELTVTGCWNASSSCGTVDNPRVTLQTRIVMPSVSNSSTP